MRGRLKSRLSPVVPDPGSVVDASVAATSNLGRLNAASVVVSPTGIAETDTAALSAAIAAAASSHAGVRVAGGTCVINTIAVSVDASIRLDDNATLKHADSSTNDMFVVAAGVDFTLRGGTVDGNRANNSYSRTIVHCVGLHAGSRVEVSHVAFTGTRMAAIVAYEFGGVLDVMHNSFVDMAEHDGTLQHATCAVNVESGEVGARGVCRFSFNRLVGTVTPALAGGSPGGIFFAPTTDYVGGLGNLSTLEAIGNYFYGIGQNCAGNDIAPIHTYPTTYGLRAVGNFMEGCGFSAIAAKSTTDAIIANNVVINGQTSAQNDPTSGAIYYTPGDHAASNSRPRAVITGNIVDTPGGTATTKQNGISVIGTPTSYADEVIVADNVVTGCGVGIWVDYARDLTIEGNRVSGASGGSSGTENGIVPNHIVGVMRVRGNHITAPNGYGFCSINGNGAATLVFEGNYVKQSHATTYGVLARGSAVEVLRDNTIESSVYAVSIDTDGTNNVGALAWDRSNVVIGGGLVNIAYSAVTRLIGRVEAPEYTPTLITGATSLWDTAAGITNASGKASAFVDRLGSYSFTQSTPGNQPTIVRGAFASRDALRFDGSASWMSTATTLATLIAGATGYLFMVLRPITASRNAAAVYDNDGVFMDTNGVFGAVLKNVGGTTPTAYGINHGGAFDNTGAAVTLARPILLGVRHAGGKLDVRLNAGAWSGNVSSTDTTPLTGGLRLGAGYDNAHFANFDVGAILTMNAALSTADDYRLLRWAQQEFGISF